MYVHNKITNEFFISGSVKREESLRTMITIYSENIMHMEISMEYVSLSDILLSEEKIKSSSILHNVSIDEMQEFLYLGGMIWPVPVQKGLLYYIPLAYSDKIAALKKGLTERQQKKIKILCYHENSIRKKDENNYKVIIPVYYYEAIQFPRFFFSAFDTRFTVGKENGVVYKMTSEACMSTLEHIVALADYSLFQKFKKEGLIQTDWNIGMKGIIYE